MAEVVESYQYQMPPPYVQQRQQELLNTLFGVGGKQGLVETPLPVIGQQVAGFSPAQQQAFTLATQGIGSFKRFLQGAQQAITQAGQTVGQVGQDISGLGQFMGAGAGTGAGSIADFQSPYQQAVIDESLRQFDRSRAGGLQQIADSAAQFGAVGGGRQGALEGQFMADTALGRAGLEAQLRAQGFADAAARRQTAFGQQQDLATQRAQLANAQAGLARQQFGLSDFQRQNVAGDVANLGQLGAFRQGLTQSQLAADQAAARTAAFEPQQRLQQFGAGLSGLAGFGGVAPQLPMGGASPLATALSTATGLAGIFGKLYGS